MNITAGSNRYVDTKNVGKLENFSGAQVKWSEGSFKARARFGLLDVGQGAADVKMDEAEKMTEAVDSSALSEDTQVARRVVYSVFAQDCGGKASSIIRHVPLRNGLECWRRLVREFGLALRIQARRDLGAGLRAHFGAVR